MPEGLRKWAEQRVSEGLYADTGDYIRALIRQDQEEAARETVWLQAMIDEGLASEPLAEDAFEAIDAVIAEGGAPQTCFLRTDQTKLSYQKCSSEQAMKGVSSAGVASASR